MKRRLLLKLLAAMAAVVLLGGITSALIIGVSTQKAFRNLVRENDVILSNAAASVFERYYVENGGWQGIDRLIAETGGMPSMMGMYGHMPGAGEMMGRGRMMSPGRRVPDGQQGRSVTPGPHSIVLTDESGNVLAHTLPDFARDKVGQNTLETGTSLWAGGKRIGYLFLGSMIEPAFGPFKYRFLADIYRSIAASTLLLVLVATGISALVFRHIMKPLNQLTHATERMSRGEYEVEVDVRRNDEIGTLSRSFFTMADSLRKTDEWKRRLIADSAHELRTPVALLQGNLEMMREGIYPADSEHLDRLYEETQLLSRLVAELRTLADAEAGAASYDFQTVDLKELLERTVSMFGVEAGRMGVEINLRAGDGSLEIRGDRMKIEQAVMNVISNALKHSPEGSRIGIELFEEGEKRCIAVEDSGPGIPEDEREKVFDRFYRTDRSRNRADGGSGLGLAVSREIMKMHGGTVEVREPEKLSGARLMFTFPVSP